MNVPRLIAVGSSAGGPAVLRQLLAGLPASYPIPIVCVQHITNGFLHNLVHWLRSECQLDVRIAAAGDLLTAGTVWFAPEDAHLQVNVAGRVSLSDSAPLGGHRPSVSTFFHSVAAAYRDKALGVLLTGMGRDGADGLLAMAQAGACTLAQDQASCAVYGMPRAAVEIGAVRHVLSISNLAAYLAGLAVMPRGVHA